MRKLFLFYYAIFSRNTHKRASRLNVFSNLGLAKACCFKDSCHCAKWKSVSRLPGHFVVKLASTLLSFHYSLSWAFSQLLTILHGVKKFTNISTKAEISIEVYNLNFLRCRIYVGWTCHTIDLWTIYLPK